jgi:hypothetical protein
MPRFVVESTFTVSAWTYVDAADREEAKRLVRGRDGALCPNGDPEQRGVNPFETFVIEAADGAPQAMTVREVPAHEGSQYLDDDSDDGDDP